MTSTPPERNNPGYTPEYHDLARAREIADASMRLATKGVMRSDAEALRWLAAEVRVMRLERALER